MFSSSRMFPGKAYSISSSTASSAMRHLAGGALLVLGQEVADQQGDVVEPVAQGRQVDGDDVQAVVQVLAEAAAASISLLQVPVGGRDDAHVDVPHLVLAHAAELPLLQDAQQLGLDFAGCMSPISSRNRVPPLASSKQPVAVGRPRR